MTQNAAYAVFIFSVISMIQEKMKTSYNDIIPSEPGQSMWSGRTRSTLGQVMAPGPTPSVPGQVK